MMIDFSTEHFLYFYIFSNRGTKKKHVISVRTKVLRNDGIDQSGYKIENSASRHESSQNANHVIWRRRMRRASNACALDEYISQQPSRTNRRLISSIRVEERKWRISVLNRFQSLHNYCFGFVRRKADEWVFVFLKHVVPAGVCARFCSRVPSGVMHQQNNEKEIIHGVQVMRVLLSIFFSQLLSFSICNFLRTAHALLSRIDAYTFVLTSNYSMAGQNLLFHFASNLVRACSGPIADLAQSMTSNHEQLIKFDQINFIDSISRFSLVSITHILGTVPKRCCC